LETKRGLFLAKLGGPGKRHKKSEDPGKKLSVKNHVGKPKNPREKGGSCLAEAGDVAKKGEDRGRRTREKREVHRNRKRGNVRRKKA